MELPAEKPNPIPQSEISIILKKKSVLLSDVVQIID